MKEIKPKDIDTSGDFMGTRLNKSELETVLRNAVVTSRKINPEHWQAFTERQYIDICTHSVCAGEIKILKLLVGGDRDVWNTIHKYGPCDGGWLQEKDGGYMVTQKTIEELRAWWKV